MTDGEVLALYQRTVDAVYRYATRLTGGDHSWADELVQETYLQVVRRVRAGERLEVDAGWLIVACRHRFLDQVKRDQRRQDREGWTQPPSPPGGGAATDALASLPVDYRTVLVLRYVDDLAVPEVARVMGRSVHATESLLVRARAALRSTLTKEASDG